MQEVVSRNEIAFMKMAANNGGFCFAYGFGWRRAVTVK
jgi:hypothetical protein